MARHHIDAVILTWNDGPLLRQAIRSVQDEAGEAAVDIIVVDNGSSPAAEVPDGVRLLRFEENLGVAAGRNRGIEAGTNPLVLLLDSDATLAPNALAALADPLDKDRSIAMSVPVFAGQSPEESAGSTPTLARKLARVRNKTNEYEPVQRNEEDQYWEVDFGIGACQLFTRDMWEKIDGIDERYFYGPEDVDFCLRVKEAGGRVVQVGAATVNHPPRRRFRGLLTRGGLAHAWAVVRFMWRHRSRTIWPTRPSIEAGA